MPWLILPSTSSTSTKNAKERRANPPSSLHSPLSSEWFHFLPLCGSACLWFSLCVWAHWCPRRNYCTGNCHCVAVWCVCFQSQVTSLEPAATRQSEHGQKNPSSTELEPGTRVQQSETEKIRRGGSAVQTSEYMVQESCSKEQKQRVQGLEARSRKSRCLDPRSSSWESISLDQRSISWVHGPWAGIQGLRVWNKGSVEDCPVYKSLDPKSSSREPRSLDPRSSSWKSYSLDPRSISWVYGIMQLVQSLRA